MRAPPTVLLMALPVVGQEGSTALPVPEDVPSTSLPVLVSATRPVGVASMDLPVPVLVCSLMAPAKRSPPVAVSDALSVAVGAALWVPVRLLAAAGKQHPLVVVDGALPVLVREASMALPPALVHSPVAPGIL